MAGFYDSVSGQGILNTIGDNPVGRWVQSKYPESQLKHDVGSAILGARDALSGTDSGAIPVPQEQADQNLQQRVGALQSDVQGMLAPTDPAHNPAESNIPPNAPVDPNSQAGGAQAQQKQQSELDVTKQQIADDATKGGGVPKPVTLEDPAGALATRNQNIQAGVGHSTTGINQPAMPTPLTDQQQKNVGLNDAGEESFKQMNTVGDWFQSRSFLMGMMQTGLSLLDGKGFGESFAQGSKYFDDHYGMEQRQSWANDLLKKGYDRQEIEQYIETGNSKILTSPAQRAAQQQQLQMQQQQAQANLQKSQLDIQNTQYAQSPEMRALDVQERQNKMDYNRAMMTQMQNNMALKQAEAPVKLQTAQTNAETARLRAQTAMEKTGVAKGTVTNSQGQPMRLGGTVGEGGGWHSVLNKSFSPITNKGQILVADKDGNNAHYISGNPGAAHMAGNNARMAINSMNKFDLGGGTQLFGVGGEMSRSFGDFWGQRTTPDMVSRIQTLQGQMEGLLTDGLIIEQAGIRPSNAEIEHKVQAIGSLLNKDGTPANISSERAAEIIQSYRDQASAIQASAEAQASGRNPQMSAEELASQVAAGTVWTAPNGQKYRAKSNGSRTDKSIWEPIQ